MLKKVTAKDLFEKLPEEQQCLGDEGYALSRQIGAVLQRITSLSLVECEYLAKIMVASVDWKIYRDSPFEIFIVDEFMKGPPRRSP